jgi:8-oxo-dGTP pyrophosphatase MutT (NUDIX family)
MHIVDGRLRLLSELDAYAAATPHEREMVARTRAFVQTHEACFERTLAPGHVTGSAWVVDPRGRAALLTHHRKLGKWLQLGGHADGDSDIRRVAAREAAEESGLSGIVLARAGIYDVDVHEIPARANEPAHLHYDVRFAFFANPSKLPTASAESHAVAWVPLSEIESYTIDDSVRRLVTKTAALVARSAQS